MSSFGQRMLGAARLDAATYEEVEADHGAIGQAAAVVVISSLAAGLGALGQDAAVVGMLVTTLAALVGWLIWAALIWAIGTKLLPEASTRSDIGELLRTLGFAAAPGILRIGGVVPVIGPLIVLVASLWMLAATVVAVRQALDYESTGRAIGVCAIGFVILLVVQILALSMMGTAPWAGDPAGAGS